MFWLHILTYILVTIGLLALVAGIALAVQCGTPLSSVERGDGGCPACW